jgi:Phosphotransferase enzyme family
MELSTVSSARIWNCFYVSSSSENTHTFKDVARDLLGKLDQLKKLPLFVPHFDLNEMNIMVDENCEVLGIVDWELSSPLPFGMGFSRIHTLAGEFSERKSEFEESERGSWQEIFNGVPAAVRKILDANLDAVQTAVTLGTLLGTFELEEGTWNPVSVEALPKFLSYRRPLIRGLDPPYLK